METPSWFIADSSCNTIESQRAEKLKEQQVTELQQMFPETPVEQLKAALAEGGDLNEVASRLLAGASAAPAPAGLSMMTQDTAPPSDMAGASMAGTEESDRELALAAARAEVAAVGSARESALSPTGQRLGSAVQPFAQQAPVDLAQQTVRQLAEGPLRLTARIARTVNEMEENLIGGEKVVTRFIIEVRQLGFTWEVARRYSQFVTFHEALSIHWIDLPELPPKLFFSTECDDLADRMVQLEKYLKVLTATPELALSPPVCAFLDAIDVAQFRSQLQARAPAPVARFMTAEAVPMSE